MRPGARLSGGLGAEPTSPEDPRERAAVLSEIRALEDEAEELAARIREALDPATDGPAAVEGAVEEAALLETLTTEIAADAEDDEVEAAGAAAEIAALERAIATRRAQRAVLEGG